LADRRGQARLIIFESEDQSVYQIRRRHRNEEVREVIGDHYQGTLCTDLGRSYDAKELPDVKRQKCIGHIQRSIDEILKNKRGSSLRFGGELKGLLKESVWLYHDFHDTTKKLHNYEK